MKHPAPNPAGVAARQWKAAGEGKLALPYCESCARFQWPPRALCLQCRGGLSWREAAGTGRIVSFSVVRRAVNPDLARDAPYVIAFVELDERVQMFTNIIGIDADAVRTGMRVRCRFEVSLDGALRVPVFAPETA
jgi:uncharacterized OB-fold protein